MADRLSSKTTHFNKMGGPIFLAAFSTLSLSWSIWSENISFASAFPMVAPGYVMAIVYWQWMKTIADEVIDLGDGLLIKQNGIEERVPISQIQNVCFRFFLMGIELEFTKPTRLGKKIEFIPKIGSGLYWDPKKPHPLVKGLLDRAKIHSNQL